MIALQPQPFDPWQVLARFEAGLPAGECGAVASFVGRMRRHNAGHAVQSLYLEHYPGMTERALAELEQEARAQWPVADLLILHRVGEVAVGEAIVLIATASAHRAGAFAACRFLIEALKTRAPLWKKERTATGEHWVEHNTPE